MSRAPRAEANRLRELGLPDAGLALEQERLLHRLPEEDGGGDGARGEVALPGEPRERVVDGGEVGHGRAGSA